METDDAILQNRSFPVTAGLVSLAAAALVALISMLVLLFGWLGGAGAFVRIFPSFAAMVPSTAICFIILSAGFLSFHARPTSRPFAIAASIFVAIAAIIDLLVVSSGRAGGIDELIWPQVTEAGDAMAFATAMNFLIASWGLFAIAGGRLQNHNVFAILLTFGLLTAMVAFVGYAFDTQALYAVFAFTAMALHTAIAFCLLFVAFLLARTGRGWMGVVTGSGQGSRSARRLLPVVIAGPLLLCFVALKMTDAGAFDANFRLSLLAIVMMFIAACAVLRNAYIENSAESRMQTTLRDLENANADKALLLREVYHRVNNNLQQINALLRIEARKYNDPQFVGTLKNMSHRVEAIGKVHRLLIAAPRPSQVELCEFLTKLCDSIASGYDLEKRGIELKTAFDTDHTHLDIAVSIGLLVNELLVNAIDHAFVPQAGGTIRVSYTKPEAGPAVLVVKDDGRGSGPGQSMKPGAGSLIIKSLVAQLAGNLEISTHDGTTATITIPADINERDRYE